MVDLAIGRPLHWPEAAAKRRQDNSSSNMTDPLKYETFDAFFVLVSDWNLVGGAWSTVLLVVGSGANA
jgi:hypothetical protein